MIKENKLLLGDCLDKLKELDDNSIDSIVSDPPYGLAFMGKKWDYDVPSQAIWEECLRVLKPGGHLLSFAGSRTYHRMAVRIEDAGFEIRDQIMWVYGSGFPKSHNIGKAVDKIEGNEREVVGTKNDFSLDGVKRNPSKHRETGEAGKEIGHEYGYKSGWDTPVDKGNSDWEGWGTALKPAHEPIVMARKPFKGTVADNVLEYGTGAINIDDCRVGNDKVSTHSNGSGNTGDKGIYGAFGNQQGSEEREGRFPANIIFECTCDNPKKKENTNTPYNYNENEYKVDGFISNIKPNAPSNYNDTNSGVIHTDPNCPCYILDQQSGKSLSKKRTNFKKDNTIWQENTGETDTMAGGFNDEGGASRFFYCPKASKKDRDEGLEVEAKSIQGRDVGQDKMAVAYKARPTERQNIHPTVKPTDLMQYLIRLVTKKGGVVLDPFMGSGSTGKAAIKEGMIFVGIERDREYFEIAKQRIENEMDKNEPKHHFW